MARLAELLRAQGKSEPPGTQKSKATASTAAPTKQHTTAKRSLLENGTALPPSKRVRTWNPPHTKSAISKHGPPSRQQPDVVEGSDEDVADEVAAQLQERLGDAVPGSLYADLVKGFAGRGGAVGAALQQQRRQQQGDSDSSEEEEDDEGEDGDDSDDGDEMDSDSGDEEDVHGGVDRATKSSAGDDTAKADASDDGDASASDDDEGQRGGSAAAARQGAPHKVTATANDADCAAINGHAPSTSGPPLPEALDPWHLHWSRDLDEADAARLQAGGTAGIKWRDAAEHADFKGAWPAARWQVAGRAELPPAPPTLAECGVKERLRVRWVEAQQQEQEALAARLASGGEAGPLGGGDAAEPARRRAKDFADDRQRTFFGLCNSYADVMLTARPYPVSKDDPDTYMDAYILHALNHVAKVGDRIKKNNDRVQAHKTAEMAAQAAAKSGGGGKAAGAAPAAPADTPRDQGFTRPKVLLLLPQRNLAFKAIRRLVQLAINETRADSVQGKEKLVEQFMDPEGDSDEEDDGRGRGGRGKGRSKPAEHNALFSGNLDDHFRVGIKITRGAVRLFVDLFQADVIVASPIALATHLAEVAGTPSADFLSSIELLIIDRADMLIMQNWAHVETVMELLNQLPREQHGVDIMRVRGQYLAGQARHYRQTLLLSSFATPDMNALAAQSCSNYAGRFRLKEEHAGVLSSVVPQVQQLFERYNATSPAEAADVRFDHFRRNVWPRMRESAGGGTLLVVPHYFDFVRLRNFLLQEDASFAAICEYSKPGEVTRSRARFFHWQRRILMYTERVHFYHRHSIRGIRDIVFYSLPEHGHYYSELVNLLEAGGGATVQHHATVSALFCRFDVLQLERVVGTARAKKMLAPGTAATFMFC